MTLSFTTFSPFALSFPLFLHIPFLHFAFNLNSVSRGNWEHVGLSGPIIFHLDPKHVHESIDRGESCFSFVTFSSYQLESLFWEEI